MVTLMEYWVEFHGGNNMGWSKGSILGYLFGDLILMDDNCIISLLEVVDVRGHYW